MSKNWVWLLVILILGGVSYYAYRDYVQSKGNFTEIESGFEDVDEEESTEDGVLSEIMEGVFNLASSTRQSRWAYWWKEFTPAEKIKYGEVQRPPGPPRVGIQAGHWKNNEVPEELSGLKRNGSGATGGGKTEADIVLEIARKVKTSLETKGVVVDLLPATIPIDYLADAFVSIHADGNNNPSVSGFKIASPQRDFSGKSVELAEVLSDNYKEETNLSEDNNITRRMSAYYAFNWRRYEHALHPMTPGVIIETGFISSPKDRQIIVNNQSKVVKGISDGILEFLNISQ